MRMLVLQCLIDKVKDQWERGEGLPALRSPPPPPLTVIHESVGKMKPWATLGLLQNICKRAGSNPYGKETERIFIFF